MSRKPILTLLALVSVCLSALAFSAQSVKNHNLTFNAFHPSQDGKIRYSIIVEVTVRLRDLSALTPLPIDGPPYEDPEPMGEPWTQETILYTTDDAQWYSPRGIFGPRQITKQEALAKGASQTKLDEALNIGPRAILVSTEFFESSFYLDPLRENAYPNSRTDRIKGSVVLDANIPAHPGNNWGLKVISALAEERIYPITLTPGQHKITITDIEAGNVLVSLYAANANGSQPNSYFQEAYALVRKNDPANISMEFEEEYSSNRYRIACLGVGQNSQSFREILPLQKDKDAMVRVMLYDAWGNGGLESNQTRSVQVNWSSSGGSGSTTFSSHISGYHTKSGRLNGLTETSVIGPVIPKEHVQPGLTVTAKLLDTNNVQVLDTKTISVDVRTPRTIIIHGFDVRPPGGSGVPLARDEEAMTKLILPYVSDVFPYSTIEYRWTNKKIWLLPWSGYGAGYLIATMIAMNSRQGWNQTKLNAQEEHLYLGMVNSKYGGESVGGVAWYGYRGLALSRIDDKRTGYNLAHEMGHCFTLEHAPSQGANDYIPIIGLHHNRVDSNYPYGGSGMAGGWGYSSVSYNDLDPEKYFLAEDSHTVDNYCRAHWDVMAYLHDTSRTQRSNRFSDYFAKRLVTNLNHPPTLDNDYWPGATTLPGTQILVFGPEAAYAAETSWVLNSMETRSIHGVNGDNIQGAPLDYIIGTHSLTGDPDDPEPPFMIVTRAPRLKGVNVDN